MSSTVRATSAQGATFVELFFDLVFVFAVTQVAGVLREHLTVTGLVEATFVFWLVWWAWTQFTWTLNAADTEHPRIELLTMTAVGAAFLMAVTVPDVFEASGWWFAGSYILVRVLGIAGQWWVSAGDAEWRAAIRTWTMLSTAGLVAISAAAVAPPENRLALLAAAVAIDVFSATRAGGGEWRLFTGHFAERHGLFVIIALGESLIAAGVGARDLPRSATLAAVVVPAVIGVCALWWTYFAHARDRLEQAMEATPAPNRARYARDVYSFLHFPIIGGVVGFAVAMEEAVAHPADHLEPGAALALLIGAALFIGGTGLALLRAGAGRPVVRAGALVALAALYPPVVAWPPAAALTAVAAVVVTVAVAEQRAGRA
ncbi:MAG TPA: low temperature requirement protein A [Euzebyales bacterium]